MSGALRTRREFLRVGSALGGGLLLSLHVDFDAPLLAQPSALAEQDATPFAPNAFVRIAPDGRTTVVINKAEMGQGVCTSLAMLLAEELDADWKQVGFEFAPVDPAYDHPGMHMQFTGGSTSVAGMSQALLQAGASARALLVRAAAQQWSVPESECRTEAGRVLHGASGRAADYGSLTASAATLPAPSEVALKDPKDYRIVGRAHTRLDTPDKSTGRAVFGIDVARPGMLTALVAHPPVFGGRARTWKDEAARRIPGVRAVVAIPSGIAVIAEGFWAAKRGRDALEIDWEDGAGAALSSAALHADYRERARKPGLVARSDGDARAVLARSARVLEADYELPYLAHAPMEPLNCVVELGADRCEVWVGSQFQTIDRAAAATAAGLPPERVQLHTTFLGGGFGRRANPVSDYIVEAVEVAKHARAPLKLVWTREDDMRGGYYRPLWHSRVRAALAQDGAIEAWAHTIVGQSFIKGTPFEPFLIQNGIDGTSVEGADDLPYAIPSVQVELHTTEVGVPTLWWRSVGHSHTAFVVESFFDELAHAAGRDPYEWRRELLAEHPRPRAVLEAAWNKAAQRPLPAGHARGVAVHYSFKSYVAHVIEASVDEHERVRVHRVCCAIDCGRVVNPDTVVAQLEGATGFGLCAALYGEITLERGRVQQSNFHDYRMLRMHEMPPVEVVIVPSNEASTGVGEPGVPTVAPALCNALFRATGKRVRRLPIRLEESA